MKEPGSIVWLATAGWLICVSGCGKSGEAPAPPKAAEASPKAGATQAAIAVPTPASPVPPPAPAPAKEAGPLAAQAAAKPAEPATPIPASAAVPQPAEPAAPSPTPAPAAPKVPGASLAALPQDQIVQGLQQALDKGLRQAIARLGHEGGFLTNLQVRIPMPEKLRKVETALRAVKQDKLADDFVVTMNRAAEQAVPEAGAVFADALKQMTIEDAKSILAGPNDAATRYFQKTTQTNLYARFHPIVQQATRNTGVTAAYKNLLEKAGTGNLNQVTRGLGGLGGALGGSLLDKDSLDIDAYVTNKAMDGLFKMVAEEEQRIRENPVARTTDLLQKVFGTLKR
jgi:hypothetical protein